MKRFPTHIVAVFGVVENEQGEVLLLKHRAKGTWMFPGGQVENGENLIDALVRETMEESGMDISVDRLFSVASNTSSHQGYGSYKHVTVPTKVMMGFACTYMGGEFRDSDESTEACWVTKERALELLTNPLLEQYQVYLKGGVQYLEHVTKPAYELKLKRNIS